MRRRIACGCNTRSSRPPLSELYARKKKPNICKICGLNKDASAGQLLVKTCFEMSVLLSAREAKAQRDEIARLRAEVAALRGGRQSPQRKARQSTIGGKLKTTRSKFRQTVDDRIGPCPQHDWRDEFAPAMQEGMRAAGLDFGAFPFRRSFVAFAEHHRKKSGMMDKVMGMGFTQQEAELILTCFCSPMAFEIRDALERGQDKYAAMTHAIARLLTTNVIRKRFKAANFWQTLDLNPAAESKGAAVFAPKCYWHLRGPGGLDLAGHP